MAKTTQTQPNKPADNLEERLKNIPAGSEGAATESTETEGTKVAELEALLKDLQVEFNKVQTERDELKLKVAELEEDKEALNEQIDELERLGTSRGDGLKIKQASDASKPEDIELKDNRVYIPGVGTIERADITEAHIKALCEYCAKENSADHEETINKYFKLKVKEVK